jgi:uncharacterized protein (DUF983 family)
MKPALVTTRKHSLAFALLGQRCPRCRSGHIFNGLFSMYSRCPLCALPFRREEGFWLGAMYCSYGLAVAILVPLFFFLKWLFPSWPGILTATVAVLPYIPFTPLIFRYSRVLWLYFENYVEPDGVG